MFSEVFMRLVQEKGITTYQVAKATGISQGLMGQYKKGDKIPTAQNLIKIADYFGVSTDYLLGKEDARQKDDIYAMAEGGGASNISKATLREMYDADELLGEEIAKRKLEIIQKIKAKDLSLDQLFKISAVIDSIK